MLTKTPQFLGGNHLNLNISEQKIDLKNINFPFFRPCSAEMPWLLLICNNFSAEMRILPLFCWLKGLRLHPWREINKWVSGLNYLFAFCGGGGINPKEAPRRKTYVYKIDRVAAPPLISNILSSLQLAGRARSERPWPFNRNYVNKNTRPPLN